MTSRPTVLLCVPRLWEKIHERITSALLTAQPLRRGLFSVAKSLGGQRIEGELIRRKTAWGTLVSDALVGKKLRARLGLDRARILLTGSAPTRPEVLKFFASFGLLIREVYGLTENLCLGVLNDHDEIVLGKTRLVYLNPSEKRGKTTEPIKAKPTLTTRQQQVLDELCRPLVKGGRFIAPASDAEIADRIYTGEANVRNHLGELYRKFEIDEGRGRRNRLAEEAIDRGSVKMKDLRDDPEDE